MEISQFDHGFITHELDIASFESDWQEFYQRLQFALLLAALDSDDSSILQIVQESLIAESQPRNISKADRSWKSRLPCYTKVCDNMKECDCSICMCGFDDGEKILKMPCKHYYHRKCIKTWLKEHNSCPVCRYELKCEDSDLEKERIQRMKKQYGRNFSLMELGSRVDRLLLCRKKVEKRRIKTLQKQLKRTKVSPTCDEYKEVQQNIQALMRKSEHSSKSDGPIICGRSKTSIGRKIVNPILCVLAKVCK